MYEEETAAVHQAMSYVHKYVESGWATWVLRCLSCSWLWFIPCSLDLTFLVAVLTDIVKDPTIWREGLSKHFRAPLCYLSIRFGSCWPGLFSSALEKCQGVEQNGIVTEVRCKWCKVILSCFRIVPQSKDDFCASQDRDYKRKNIIVLDQADNQEPRGTSCCKMQN